MALKTFYKSLQNPTSYHRIFLKYIHKMSLNGVILYWYDNTPIRLQRQTNTKHNSGNWLFFMELLATEFP